MAELLRNAHPAFRSLVLILLLTNLICGYHFYILLHASCCWLIFMPIYIRGTRLHSRVHYI